MSDDPWGLERLRFEYINPGLLMKNPRVLKDSRFEYLIPELARADFKLPGEEEPKKEFGWAELKALLAGSRLSNAKNDEADTKGNEPMDEELFTEEAVNRLTEPEGASPRNSEYYETLVVDIETYTKHALELQMAIVEAETNLENAKRRHRKADSRLVKASRQWSEADRALDDARAKLKEHLELVRKTHVTLRGTRYE